MSRFRSVAAAAISVASLTGLAGCAVFSPPTVLTPYEPSDGLSAEVGSVKVRNALLASPGEGQPGVVSAALVNDDTAPAQVEVGVDTGGAPATSTFTVQPGSTLTIGSGSGAGEVTETDVESDLTGWFQVPAVTEVPGELVPMTFRVGGEEATIDVLVVRPCFEYAALAPTPAPGAPAAGASTPTPTLNCAPDVAEEEEYGEEEE